jgi:hypothetical protein
VQQATENRVLFHVGWPKTATTSLQRQIREYPNLAGKPFHRNGGDEAVAVIHELCTADEWVPASLDHLLAQSRSNTQLPVILSDEGLIAMPQRVWFEGLVSPEERAYRLSRTSWNASILMMLREPVSQLRSTWMHWVREGYAMNYEDFLLRVKQDRSQQTGTFAVQSLVECYASLFGSRNVIVSDYEAFVAQPERFWRQLSLVLDVPMAEHVETQQLERLNSMHLGPLRMELAINSGLTWYSDSFGSRDKIRMRRFVTRRVSHHFAPKHAKYFARYQALEQELARAIGDEMNAVKRWTTRIGT